MCHFLAPVGQPEMMHKNFMRRHLRISVARCSGMKFFWPFSAEHTANQAAGFTTKSAAFFVLQKIFEIISLRGLKNEPSRWLPIEGQNKFPRDPWKQNTHSTGTFLIGGESPSRMKVRHELLSHKGYHGKQGAIPNHSEISVCCG